MRSRSDGPRNRKAAAASARARELLRQTLLEYTQAHPLSRPPTAAELRRMTRLKLSERRIQEHVRSIQIEAEIRDLLAEQLPSPGVDTTPEADHVNSSQ